MTVTVTVRDDSVFTKPSVPKNSWQLLLWVIFEPFLLERYSATLSKKQSVIIFLRVYAWIALISFVLYLMICFVTVAIDAPTLFSAQYKSQFVNHYRELTGFEQKIFFVIQEGIVKSITLIALFSAVGIVLAIFGLTEALAFELMVGLIMPLSAAGIENGVIAMVVAGGGLGLVSLLMYGVGREPRYKAISGAIFGAIIGIGVGFAQGGITGIAFVLSWYFSLFRIYFYPFHFIRSLLNVNFRVSPYHKDAVIWLPIWGVEKKLRRLALETPEDALKFVHFLREYLPLQTKLADSIAHAASAGTWLNQPLIFEVLQPPLIENDKFKPSDLWLKQLAELKTQIISYRHQTQLSLRQQYFQRFLKQLDDFSAQTLVENKRWRDEYLQALAFWKKIALEEKQKLDEQAKQQEPITANVYLSGEALHPESNAKIFLGREDLINEMARRIASARQMPMFLFQGQRRVGKTSLLNFLEPLLGSGFKVVFQDLQKAQTGSTVQSWLSNLQMLISQKLELPVAIINDKADGDWLSAWQNFETWLESLDLNHSYKLILAFDEYEGLHHRLQADPEQGKRLLAAMRSFSQHQNHIVFLFVGAALFTELDNPPWGQYFVQAQTFKVDYLPKTEALQLIAEPVGLVYPPELLEKMFDLTQGHPSLLQMLCSEMVNIANRTMKKNMTQADLDQVITELIKNSSIAPMAIFWQQFCVDSACKATVREIMNTQPPTDKKKLHRLREHGFIVQDSNGLWRLRVPLFERWLRAFDRVDLD